MNFTAQQIATLVGGKIEGDSNVSVNSVAKIETGKKGDLCFLSNEKYENYIYKTDASILLVNNNLVLKNKVSSTLIRVENPYVSFTLLLKTYQDIIGQKIKKGIEPQSFVDASATIAEDVYIGAFSYISENVIIGKNTKIYPNCFIGENVKIGNNTIIHPGVKIYENCEIGNNIIIHAGTVIGSDGFGFAFENGSYQKIPQLGNVIIEDEVEIGANCTLDRATIGNTIIKKGSKLDNLIQIAHNVTVGENTVIAAQAGISGSTNIGNQVMIGGQAGIVGHIKIADGVKINAQSGVSKEINEENYAVTGSPAFEYRPALKSQVIFKNLPDLLNRIIQLENEIKKLTS